MNRLTVTYFKPKRSKRGKTRPARLAIGYRTESPYVFGLLEGDLLEGSEAEMWALFNELVALYNAKLEAEPDWNFDDHIAALNEAMERDGLK